MLQAFDGKDPWLVDYGKDLLSLSMWRATGRLRFNLTFRTTTTS
jgi:hypothetical protein